MSHAMLLVDKRVVVFAKIKGGLTAQTGLVLYSAINSAAQTHQTGDSQ
jgi:hypothetical protein